jgi:hypothetical protein
MAEAAGMYVRQTSPQTSITTVTKCPTFMKRTEQLPQTSETTICLLSLPQRPLFCRISICVQVLNAIELTYAMYPIVEVQNDGGIVFFVLPLRFRLCGVVLIHSQST